MPSTTHLIAVVALTFLAIGSSAWAEAMRTAAVGCQTAADAEALARTPASASAKLADRSCIDFRKNLVVDVDERKPPLACIRLTGDLSCWWVQASSIDEHPGQKGGAPGKAGGRHH